MPPTESARSALSSFTCTLCNKSYSRHPEYEAHIGSYDHQHRKRLQDLKQLSRDPNAAEKARRAERKADAEAGLRLAVGEEVRGRDLRRGVLRVHSLLLRGGGPVKKNVLGDDDEGEVEEQKKDKGKESQKQTQPQQRGLDVESETDEEDYYDPRRPTGCAVGCGVKV
ncbi:Zinc finger C2H2 [Penicillium citrinum]|uniref:Zinc finger C2H2 n=1 Tax=Penicillium citrinum TaxID=5077 RepID=A0A9W9PC86_PENCI|nr:Zinc finger C2H2 [Penicillium citrinum]KAJ5241880.1 Zinc finger C2H2 [Penicillium citrinum]